PPRGSPRGRRRRRPSRARGGSARAPRASAPRAQPGWPPPPRAGARAAGQASREGGRASFRARSGSAPCTPHAWSSRGLPLQLVPALPEGPARHRGEIARPRPVTEEREAPDRAVTDEGTLQDAGDAARQPVEERARQEPPERREHDPLDPGRDPLLVHLAPELDEHARDIDPHRARVGTRPAE